MCTMIKSYSFSRTPLYWLGSAALLLLGFMASCSKEKASQAPMAFEQPANFPPLRYKLEGNLVQQDVFVLGRTLFYDGQLSSTGKISCGSCHQQSVAFAHADHSVSHGVFDRLGTRNAPALQNLGFYKTFMWDGGIFDLDLQPLAPLENHVEMDEQMDHVLTKLQQSAQYKLLFQKAYGSSEITSVKMLKAMAQFMVMMVSANSRYDKYVRQEAGANFTADEKEGLQLFKAKCQSCHATDLFTDQTFRNNGLPPAVVNDLGRYAVTLNSADRYSFKVPSLRNVANTMPYMHDGRFWTLEQVMDHYANGVVNSPTLDPLLNNGSSLGIPLTVAEKNKIITFLKTLTDETFIRDRRFAEQ